MTVPGCWRAGWEYRSTPLGGSHDGVQLPFARHPLQLVATAISELKSRPCNQVSHCTRHDDFARCGRCHYSGTNVYGDPAQLAARHLAFASVDAGADPKSQPSSPSTIADAQRIARAGPS